MKNDYDMFDLESYCIVRELVWNTKNGALEATCQPYIQRYALNTTLTLCCGIGMDEVYDDLLREILPVGSTISLLRSVPENNQDYIPILRYLPNNERNARSKTLREGRNKYLNELLDKVRAMMKKGTEKACISAAIPKEHAKIKTLGFVFMSLECLDLVKVVICGTF
jgi:phenylacetate 2-hydroxylase